MIMIMIIMMMITITTINTGRLHRHLGVHPSGDDPGGRLRARRRGLSADERVRPARELSGGLSTIQGAVPEEVEVIALMARAKVSD